MASDILFDKGYWIERARHREEVFQNLERFLQKRNKTALESLLRSLWASEAISSIDKAIDRRIINRGFTVGDIAEKLEVVKKDPEKLVEEKIPGFGPASITEILFCIDPERFAVFNKRANVGLKKFGHGDFERNVFTRDLYKKFTMAIEQVVQDFELVKENIEEKVGISIPKFDFIDGVFNLLYEGKLSIDEFNELKQQLAIGNMRKWVSNNGIYEVIQKVAQQYIYQLEKGDSKENAIEKAVYYGVGMIDSFKEFHDPKKKHSLVITLETIAELTRGIANLLRERS
ncbi:hypothetical protein OCC_04315 [Thermococcus litoralis DSM 5473]|uniref:Uncharacterized protein n=1 Tax=Thermococcus litoralis (strain ATCC 51850 / DSM 5473 / JCM 8560 / NS-C) TaxID=523849 RepID=H3ZPK8_THELN|nr:hypothetical protein [Thermococcus litoralis]EHR78052.1 hypothetical protein OCC_04315 [Thermococcus litoralis DSM 5473]